MQKRLDKWIKRGYIYSENNFVGGAEMATRQAKKMLESIMEFGKIPRYAVKVHCGRLHVWKNNGQVPSTRSLSKIEKLSGSNGYATWIGVFEPDEVVEYLGSIGYLPRKEEV